MTNKVPAFPGKGQGQAVPPWERAMCPLLTAGEIARFQKSTVLVPGVQEQPTAQGCKGQACMWFIQTKGPNGEIGGACSQAFQTQFLMELNVNVSRFIAAAEAGARAEAARAAGQAEPAPSPSPPGVPAPSPLTDEADKATDE